MRSHIILIALAVHGVSSWTLDLLLEDDTEARQLSEHNCTSDETLVDVVSDSSCDRSCDSSCDGGCDDDGADGLVCDSCGACAGVEVLPFL